MHKLVTKMIFLSSFIFSFEALFTKHSLFLIIKKPLVKENYFSVFLLTKKIDFKLLNNLKMI